MSQKNTIEYNPFKSYDHFIRLGREGDRPILQQKCDRFLLQQQHPSHSAKAAIIPNQFLQLFREST
jgi:hypothetical protein